MSRPCGHAEIVEGCAFCFLYDRHPAWRDRWAGKPVQPKRKMTFAEAAAERRR